MAVSWCAARLGDDFLGCIADSDLAPERDVAVFIECGSEMTDLVLWLQEPGVVNPYLEPFCYYHFLAWLRLGASHRAKRSRADEPGFHSYRFQVHLPSPHHAHATIQGDWVDVECDDKEDPLANLIESGYRSGCPSGGSGVHAHDIGVDRRELSARASECRGTVRPR